MTLRAASVSIEHTRGRPVLLAVSLEAAPGEVTAVVGPNASGKTTLLRALLGVLRPREGEVTLDGRPVASLRRREHARRLAYVPQRPDVASAFTVEEVVRLGRHALGVDGGSVERALQRTGLAEHRRALHHSLSAGQQQRVAIARALTQLDPWGERPGGAAPERYLLADEPTSAMDPRHALATLDLLRDLARCGLGVCVVLHDLTAARRAAGRVVLLDEAGRVAGAGSAAEVLRPDVLAPIFGVRFEEWTGTGGAALVAVAPEGNGAGP